jgi:hypothetical protein
VQGVIRKTHERDQGQRRASSAASSLAGAMALASNAEASAMTSSSVSRSARRRMSVFGRFKDEKTEKKVRVP